VLDVEDSARHVFDKNLSDEQFLEALKRERQSWEQARKLLDAQLFLPEVLHSDTFKLRRYIGWRMKQTDYRIAMVEKESYVYMDSIEVADNKMRPFLSLDYVLNMLRVPAQEEPIEQAEEPRQEPIRQWYNEDWEEIPYPPGSFYRIGVRDSLGQWQGPVRDFYANGDVQMKGNYKNSQRDGIFIYYSDHRKYESAGRYVDDRHVGKWESYHPNGRIESEVYYRDRYFLKNWWDSLGVQQVKDGEGHKILRYANGVIAEEGDYRDGYQEGVWVGHHPNGELFYEEYYANGRLVRGRSRDKQGRLFVYDETSFFPVPEGGFQKYEDYLQKESERVMPDQEGSVKLSFRITPSGKMVELKVEKSLSLATDEKAKEIVRKGPTWQPAHEHGFVPIDGYQQVVVNFVKSI
jgi:antitoxin component YwqK of YwqJK toxin-antitoxin module